MRQEFTSKKYQASDIETIKGLGTRYRFNFPNGYGLSVVNYGYGDEKAPFEIAVFFNKEIDYSVIENGVLGYLTAEEVESWLDNVQELYGGAIDD